MKRMTRLSKGFICAVLLLFLSVVPAAAEPIPVKVLVLSMFEVGANTGDFAGEFQLWYEEYFKTASSFDVKGAESSLFINGDGVAGTVTGMGKARAATTLMAVLKDPRFDFSKTYFITSGCSGVSPERGTLGDVFFCDWVVDYDLGHSWKESDAAPASADAPKNSDKTFFILKDSYKENAAIPLNGTLVKWALALTKDLVLEDSPKAAEYRKLYSQETANGKPSIRTGTSVTGDNYWHGRGSSAQASRICETYGASPYGVTQMEDNAFAIVLRAMGYLDRYLVIRDVVNFDQPHPKQSVPESLAASSGGFAIGMINGHRAGTAVVHRILSDWATWEAGIPVLPAQ